MTTTKRRICWPYPDATCLEGGCLYCNEYPFRTVSSIEKYVSEVDDLPNRAVGQKSALAAFDWGQRHGWPNIDCK